MESGNTIIQTHQRSNRSAALAGIINYMKKAFFFIQCILLILAHSSAQEMSKANRPAFYSLLQAGVTNGKKTSSLTIEGKFGLRFSNTSVGIGAGVDYYNFRPVP